MNSRDFLLLVVAASDAKPLTPVQLQKSMFLISEAKLAETPTSFYEFEPYHYGPFDSEVYVDADVLQGEGLVIRMPSTRGAWTDTIVTPEGLIAAKSIEQNLSSQTTDYVKTVVEWVLAQTFSGLLRAIYEKYPAYRENSVFQG